jgi:hypothetical protein
MTGLVEAILLLANSKTAASAARERVFVFMILLTGIRQSNPQEISRIPPL